MSTPNDIIRSIVDNKIVIVNTITGDVLYRDGKKIKFSKTKDGYMSGKIRGHSRITVYQHRIVAYAIYGEAALKPGIQIDHINHDRADNRPANLRPITKAENIRRKRAKPWTIDLNYTVVDCDNSVIAAFKFKKDANAFADSTPGSRTQIISR